MNVTRKDVGAVAFAAGYLKGSARLADHDEELQAELYAYTATLNQLLSKLVEQRRAQR